MKAGATIERKKVRDKAKREKEAEKSIDKILDNLLKDFFSKPNKSKTIARGKGYGKATI